MPRTAVIDSKRMSLRISPEAKAKLMRAATLQQADLTNFVTLAALREAQTIIDAEERITVSEQSYLRVLELLEHPPQPNAKLLAAAKALPLQP